MLSNLFYSSLATLLLKHKHLTIAFVDHQVSQTTRQTRRPQAYDFQDSAYTLIEDQFMRNAVPHVDS